MKRRRNARPHAASMRLGLALTKLALAAGQVVAARTLQMASGAMSGAEAARMTLEKPAAFAEAARRAGVAAASGANATAIAAAALRPIGKAAAANARRLRRTPRSKA